MKKFALLICAATSLAPTASLADWSGAYVGGSVSTFTTNEVEVTNGNASATVDFDTPLGFGLHAGYRVETSGIVIGGEFAVTLGALTFEDEAEPDAEIDGDIRST